MRIPSNYVVGFRIHSHSARMRSEGYTVVVLCVCVSRSVCLFVSDYSRTTGYRRRLMSDTNSFSATRARKRMWRFR